GTAHTPPGRRAPLLAAGLRRKSVRPYARTPVRGSFRTDNGRPSDVVRAQPASAAAPFALPHEEAPSRAPGAAGCTTNGVSAEGTGRRRGPTVIDVELPCVW
ncbi:hypothetical protein, partial [Streptomyces sp. NPDC059134]|uniref:hypothetical protein n=1 Tax=Streptomyces sp. NPDC059134 TaxID=3346738 RepID=UPI0036A6E79A